MMDFAIEALKWTVFLTGIIDSIKYKWLAQKVARMKSSKDVSRKFINASIINRVFLLIYAHFILHDWVITWTSVVALWTMGEAFFYVYWYYPYKNKKKKGFKRPSIIKYTIHSFTPNKWAGRL